MAVTNKELLQDEFAKAISDRRANKISEEELLSIVKAILVLYKDSK